MRSKPKDEFCDIQYQYINCNVVGFLGSITLRCMVCRPLAVIHAAFEPLQRVLGCADFAEEFFSRDGALKVSEAFELGLVEVVDDDGDEEVYDHEGADDDEGDEVDPCQGVQFHGGEHDLDPSLEGDDVEEG